MNREKVKSYLGICNKAGYLIIGADKLKTYDKKLYLILTEQESSKTIQKVVSKFQGIETIMVENLSDLVSIENCKLVGIKNFGLSEEIRKGIRGE